MAELPNDVDLDLLFYSDYGPPSDRDAGGDSQAVSKRRSNR